MAKFFGTILYGLEYVLLFPVFTFFWFSIFALLLIFLIKYQTVHNILIVSMATVAAIRVSAYYNENLAQDLAKMIPFALLGVFLVEIPLFSLNNSLLLVKEMFGLQELMIYYLVFIIVLEFLLRISRGIILKIFKS